MIKILNQLEKWEILNNENLWYYKQTEKIYSLVKSIQKYKSTSLEDLKQDFYIHIMNKDIKTKNGLMISFINYCKNVYNKSKNKQKTIKYDKFKYQTYYNPKFDKYGLTIFEKRYLAFFTCKYIEKKSIKPQELNLQWLLKEKGVNRIDKISGREKFNINRSKHIKVIKLLIIQLYNYLPEGVLNSKDKLLITYIKDSILMRNVDNYLGKLDILDQYGLRTKEHKIMNLCKNLLIKIIQNIE